METYNDKINFGSIQEIIKLKISSTALESIHAIIISSYGNMIMAIKKCNVWDIINLKELKRKRRIV
jgi:hypothetical protein